MENVTDLSNPTYIQVDRTDPFYPLKFIFLVIAVLLAMYTFFHGLSFNCFKKVKKLPAKTSITKKKTSETFEVKFESSEQVLDECDENAKFSDDSPYFLFKT